MSGVLETHSAAVEEEGAEILRVNQYTLRGKLGEGAYGVVLECDDNKQQKFAIKVLSKSLLKRQKEYTKVGRKMTVTTAFDDVKKEIAVMKKLSHPKLVQLFEVIDDPDNDKLFMVMELVNGGQVMEWNKDTKGFTANPRLVKPGGTGHEMSESNANLVIRDVLVGLAYLHSSHIVHRDLKPQNLLLTGSTDRICVKIADFGVSHMFDIFTQGGENGNSEGEKLTKVKGTYPFYAPECLEPQAFDGYKADVWALGINLYCFLTGRLPFYDESPPDLFDLITNNPIDFDLLSRDFGCSEQVVEFARTLLEKNAEKRPASAQAVINIGDPWLGEFVTENRPTITEVTEAEISAAFTPLDLSLYTVANLKIFAHKWRRRAASNAMRRKEDELRKSMLSEQESASPTVGSTSDVSSSDKATVETSVVNARVNEGMSMTPVRPIAAPEACRLTEPAVAITVAEPIVASNRQPAPSERKQKRKSQIGGGNCTIT